MQRTTKSRLKIFLLTYLAYEVFVGRKCLHYLVVLDKHWIILRQNSLLLQLHYSLGRTPMGLSFVVVLILFFSAKSLSPSFVKQWDTDYVWLDNNNFGKEAFYWPLWCNLISKKKPDLTSKKGLLGHFNILVLKVPKVILELPRVNGSLSTPLYWFKSKILERLTQ